MSAQRSANKVALNANSKITLLPGVGPKLAEKLAALGINSIKDLWFHFPLRYQDRTRITPIGSLHDGLDAVIEGEIRIASIAMGRRRSLMVKLQDGTGTLTLRFFHFSRAQQQQLQAGMTLRCFGTVRRGGHTFEMVHPEYRQIQCDAVVPVEDALTPIYPTTAGIGQTTWRKLCSAALQILEQNEPLELLPPSLSNRIDMVAAIRLLHQPPPDISLKALAEKKHPAQERLALEELIAHRLTLTEIRQHQTRQAAPELSARNQEIDQFLLRQPFTATAAQRRVIAEISSDLARSTPMLRLLQGDVGAGKTLVAAAAALHAVSNGFQVAIMAPTELLAEQHWRNFNHWFKDSCYALAWLSGKTKGRKRAAALASIGSGDAAIVIGTHALFQTEVDFKQLGLIIIDEQHRFGVEQRLSLARKGKQLRPHQLVMTATPIPRSLSMVAYADLDCSVIDELPPGRQAISTVLIDAQRRQTIIDRVANACRLGRQAYWVCTLIEENEQLEAQAAEAVCETLRANLPDISIGLIHGRLKSADKEHIMSEFAQGKIQLLVATTVIEVGVDVPNASLMIIENPERLGLAQLHQLRGRVGRGTIASHCVLMYQTPLSQTGRARLKVLKDSQDGFFIAEQDLLLRGPGELLGTRQTGLMAFRVAELPLHEYLLDEAEMIANQLLRDQPDAAHRLARRWTGSRSAYAAA